MAEDYARIKLLIERGANINARNTWGETPLQVAVTSRVCGVYSSPELAKSITLLVSSGADVESKDYRGRSISQSAYLPTQFNTSWGITAYRGDIWDAALSSCGYDLLERRAAYPRIPAYFRPYSRQSFERLWRGREDQCPYYDDPPHWPLLCEFPHCGESADPFASCHWRRGESRLWEIYIGDEDDLLIVG